jgi:hypothetical protein
MDTLPPLFGSPGQPVPSVDPDDLKIVYELFQDIERQNPEQQVGVDIGVFKEVCKPDADISALAYRSMMLRLLAGPAPSKELEPHWKNTLAPWTHDGHLDAAVYREFAQLPMEWIGVGVVRQGPPFDAELLFRRLSEGADS